MCTLLPAHGPLYAAEATEGDTCTFSPAINPASQRLLEDSASVPSDFQERLRYYSQRRDQRQRQLQAEQVRRCGSAGAGQAGDVE